VKYGARWTLPEVTFYEITEHGFTGEHEGKPLYGYGKPNDLDHRGMPKTGELYESLDRALIAWVGEKYTGPRGAGGTGVGTAADWFARMIGMDQLVEPEFTQGQKTLQDALYETQREDGPLYRRARAMTDWLAARGVYLAVRKG
jgi:hypothetical protein